MTERLTETQVHEWLDTNGYLDQSHNEGCYAIELHVPENPEKLWFAEKDVSPPESGFFQAIEEQGIVYVGGQPAKRVGSIIRPWPRERPATVDHSYLPTSCDVRRVVW